MIEAKQAQKLTKLSLSSVYKLIDDLERLEILQEITGGKRKKVYFFKDYITLFK